MASNKHFLAMFALVSLLVLSFLPRTAFSIPFVVFHGDFSSVWDKLASAFGILMGVFAVFDVTNISSMS